MAELDILKLSPNIKRRLDNRILGTFKGPHLLLPSILILREGCRMEFFELIFKFVCFFFLKKSYHSNLAIIII